MFYLYVGYLLIMSLLDFILMVLDKNYAKQKKRRIPEKTLLLCAAFGGAVGGFLAMYTVRHKTKHWYFVVLMPLFAVGYLALTIFLLYNGILKS